MRVLFVVTARGGSKGVPRKNIAYIGKYPLVAYKIIAAQKSKYDKRIIVSTDDREIADVSKKYGAEVPFMRPHELATDDASSMDVVEHAMRWIEENDENHYDYVCLMEPSSPFLSYIDVDKAIELLSKSDADSLIGVKEAEVSSIFIHPLDRNGRLSLLYRSLVEMKSLRRQDQIKEYTPNGCIYLAKWDYLKNRKQIYAENSVPYIMPSERSIEIDTNLDLLVAETLVSNGMMDLADWD